jgi:hypothetical protein
MIDISSIRLILALAGLGIAGLAFVMKCTRKPKRAEKWEKAQIMKQLLALSEQEANRVPGARSVRLRPPVSKPAMRPSNAYMKARTKTTLPGRSR